MDHGGLQLKNIKFTNFWVLVAGKVLGQDTCLQLSRSPQPKSHKLITEIDENCKIELIKMTHDFQIKTYNMRS